MLYVVPEGYDLTNAVKVEQRVRTVTWNEIVNFLREQNDSDPMIGLIYNKVDNVEVEQVKTLEAYKAKVYEVMIRLCALNRAITINLDGENVTNYPFTSHPAEMKEGEWAGIDFSYGDFGGEFWFGKKDIWLYFRSEVEGYDDILEEQGFEYFESDNAYQMLVVTQDDFWEKNTDELALVFNTCVLCHQYAYNEISKKAFDYSRILLLKLKPELGKIAEKHSLELDADDIEEGSFCFNAESWRYGFEFDTYDWSDFYYGIKYYDENGGENITKQQKKTLTNILKDSTDATDWYPSWKYAEEPYRNWNGETFEAISENPEQFGEFVESKLSEIEKALKKAELI